MLTRSIRAKNYDQAIEASLTALSNPDTRLPEARIMKLRGILENTYLPNLRFSELTRPSSVTPERTAFVPVRKYGLVFIVTTKLMAHPSDMDHQRTAIKLPQHVEGATSNRNRVNPEGVIPPVGSVIGVRRGTPLDCLASTVIHEATHVLLRHEDPDPVLTLQPHINPYILAREEMECRWTEIRLGEISTANLVNHSQAYRTHEFDARSLARNLPLMIDETRFITRL